MKTLVILLITVFAIGKADAQIQEIPRAYQDDTLITYELNGIYVPFGDTSTVMGRFLVKRGHGLGGLIVYKDRYTKYVRNYNGYQDKYWLADTINYSHPYAYACVRKNGTWDKWKRWSNKKDSLHYSVVSVPGFSHIYPHVRDDSGVGIHESGYFFPNITIKAVEAAMKEEELNE